MNIGTKIKTFRKNLNLSQEDLCGDLISRTILSRIENNRMLPSLPQLEYLSEKLGVPIFQFFHEASSNSTPKAELPCSLEKMFSEKNYGELIRFSTQNSKAFSELDNFNKYFLLGMSYYNLEMHKQTLSILRKYVIQYKKASYLQQTEHILDFATALNILFKVSFINRNVEKGLGYLLLGKKYLAQFDALNTPISYKIHNNLGCIYLELNQYHKSIEILENFLKGLKEPFFLTILPDIHLCLNIAYYNTGNYVKSLEHIKKSTFFYLYTGKRSRAGSTYLNYINALRYNRQFKEALQVLQYCKAEYRDDLSLQTKLLIQEMILYFNKDQFEKVLALSKNIDIGKLKASSKANYQFMLGHVHCIKSNSILAQHFLQDCETYFIQQNFTYDLAYVYHDLFLITEIETFKTKAEHYKMLKGRKNVVVDFSE